MNKLRFVIPATYFDPKEITENLIIEHCHIRNHNFINHNASEYLPNIFDKLNSNLNNVKVLLRLHPNDCITILNSIVNEDEKDFNKNTSHLKLSRSMMINEEQKNVSESLENSLKILRGFFTRDIKYFPLVHSFVREDQEKLIGIASQTCYEVIHGMVRYLETLKQQLDNHSTTYLQSHPQQKKDASAIQRYIQQKNEKAQDNYNGL